MKKSKSTPIDKAAEFFCDIADNQYTLSQLRKRRKQGKFLTVAESRRLVAADKKATQKSTQA